jgi:hypothetical protein
MNNASEQTDSEDDDDEDETTEFTNSELAEYYDDSMFYRQ